MKDNYFGKRKGVPSTWEAHQHLSIHQRGEAPASDFEVELGGGAGSAGSDPHICALYRRGYLWR